MANTDVQLSIQAMATLLAGLDPDPQPAPVAVWAFPWDFTPDSGYDITFDSLPVIIVREVVNVTMPVQYAGAGLFIDRWVIEVRILLKKGEITTIAGGVEVEQMHSYWYREMTRMLAANSDLNGTVDGIGKASGNDFFDKRAGHLNWGEVTFWGVRCLIPVYKKVVLPIF